MTIARVCDDDANGTHRDKMRVRRNECAYMYQCLHWFCRCVVFYGSDMITFHDVQAI